jgi:hypothetical protein
VNSALNLKLPGTRRFNPKTIHAERLDLIAEEEADLPVRAIAAWLSSGMRWVRRMGNRTALPISWRHSQLGVAR